MEFTFTPTGTDWARISPELVMVATALLILLADLALPRARRGWLALVALAGVVGAGVAVAWLGASGNQGPAFFGMVSSDLGALVADALILLACGLAVLLSPGYIERQGVSQLGEYYALMALAAAGMMLMASALNLMTIFIGLELLSLCLYVLSAFIARRFASQEAGMKYFLLSSFASGFLVYGMSLTYGATGSTALEGIRAYLEVHTRVPATGFGPLLLAGLALMAVGFCFKVSAVPFHFWTPDVYTGAPTSVTAFMSVATKVAAFAAIARVYLFALAPVRADWQPIFWGVAILSMVGGNVLAVTQTDVKRLLAYSSVAQAGYILIGIAVGTRAGYAASLVYLATYTVMNIGAFGVVAALERADGQGTTLADYAGLARRRPWLAAAMLLCLLALAGIPPLAGFLGKWAVFYSAVTGGHTELAIVGLLASIAGVYYYLRVVWAMYFAEAAEGSSPPAPLPAGRGEPERAMGAPGLAQAPVAAPAATGGTAVATAPAATAVVAAPTPIPAPALPLTGGLALLLATGATLLALVLAGPLFDLAQRAAAATLR
ncbi:MAG TPA: NADH-quinone oxidoreductase subunit N [Ktedonobacterales bacterium]|nr:NADH-quinone oxidoreductase subunit N [Ktedonobacterales bacterium]